MSLLKLLGDALPFMVLASAASTMRRVVVLPLEPVMATTLPRRRPRHHRPRSPSATRVSPTSMSGNPAGRANSPARRSTIAAAAPCAAASAKKAWASNFSPRRATNSFPRMSSRVSVATPFIMNGAGANPGRGVTAAGGTIHCPATALRRSSALTCMGAPCRCHLGARQTWRHSHTPPIRGMPAQGNGAREKNLSH